MPRATIEERREYQAEWRARNPDRVRAVRKAWTEANPEKIAEYKSGEKYKAKRARWGKKHYAALKPHERKARAVNAARCNARTKGLEFNLTVDVLMWPTHCPVLGIELNYGAPKNGKLSYDSPSLDRTDPKQGYVIGNVVVMSWRANRIKTDATNEELFKLAEYIRRTRSN